MKNTFSVIICTYNGARTIGLVLDAILKLTNQDDLLEEIIIVDNASNDSTKAIVLKYISVNKKIKYIYEKEQGLSNARRHAIYAKAPWVLYVDDDNILAEDWLERANQVIKNNPNVGIINGAVIGIPIEGFSIEEKIRFKAIYKNLACTHLYNYYIIRGRLDKTPMGAGLCIKTDALRKVAQDGWLVLPGRKGNELSSGEDTELCEKVLKLGYRYIRDYSLRLEHLIPKSRLTEEYTTRLLTNLTLSKYANLNNKKLYVLERMLRIIKYGLRYLCIKVKEYFFDLDSYEIERNRQLIITYKVFAKCVFRDYFFLRRSR